MSVGTIVPPSEFITLSCGFEKLISGALTALVDGQGLYGTNTKTSSIKVTGNGYNAITLSNSNSGIENLTIEADTARSSGNFVLVNGTANFIKGINQEPQSIEDRPVQKITVPMITLQDIYNEIGTNIDLLKLDIEGAEYEVLLDADPIPKQITVEFHEHCHTDLHNKYIDAVVEHLCKDYNMTMFVREWPRYKYMDVLFTRKDL